MPDPRCGFERLALLRGAAHLRDVPPLWVRNGVWKKHRTPERGIGLGKMFLFLFMSMCMYSTTTYYYTPIAPMPFHVKILCVIRSLVSESCH